eukprot:COSAG05_NODE_3458_length_2049_cov_0.952821_3_plen_142_part_00
MIPTITGAGNISVTNNVVSLNNSPSIVGTLFTSTIGAVSSLVSNIYAATINVTSLFVTTIGSSTSLVSDIYTSAIRYTSSFTIHLNNAQVFNCDINGHVSIPTGNFIVNLPTSTQYWTSADNGRFYKDANGFVKSYSHSGN